MKKEFIIAGLLIFFSIVSSGFIITAEAQPKGAWVEYQLPGDRPPNWARMVGENCLIFMDRMGPEIYAFDINSAEWHTYTAATELEWNSQIKVGRNVAFVYNDEMAVVYNGLSQEFAPVTYTGTMLSNTTYGHDCEADMAYFATDQNFYVYDAEDALWRSYDISGFGSVIGWGCYGIEDYIYLYLNALDDSKKIVAYSYITKTFSEYDGEGYILHESLQHGFVFYKNSPPPDSLTHFFAGYSAYTGDYVSQLACNHQPGWNSMAARGKPGTTYFFTDNERVVDNLWRHDMWGFDTRHGNLVYSSFSYDYVCSNGIQTYVMEAGSSIAVDSYRDCLSGEITYIIYNGNSNTFQTVIDDVLYYPTCGTNANPHCGGSVIGASDCDYLWFFDAEGWIGNGVALPATVDGYSNPAGQRMYGTWGMGECQRALTDVIYFYSYNRNGNSIQTRQVECHTLSGRMDSTNVGGFYAPYRDGDTVLLLYSPGTDTWLTRNFSTEGTAWAHGIRRDFIYYYDYGSSGPMIIFDGVTGEEISLPFGWAFASTANSRKYSRSNFMIVYSTDDRYTGYSCYTRTHSEYAGEYMSSWRGQEDVTVASKPITGGGADILAYNVLYDNFVMTTLGTEYGTYFDIWVGGKTALIMTLPGYLLAWDPHADAAVDVNDNADNSELPDNYGLSQNYPNPFNPSTVIGYSIPKRCDVIISIFNLLGRTIRTISNENQPAGKYRVDWDGTDQSGRAVASGIYFYQIKTDNYVESRKMVLLK